MVSAQSPKIAFFAKQDQLFFKLFPWWYHLILKKYRDFLNWNRWILNQNVSAKYFGEFCNAAHVIYFYVQAKSTISKYYVVLPYTLYIHA